MAILRKLEISRLVLSITSVAVCLVLLQLLYSNSRYLNIERYNKGILSQPKGDVKVNDDSRRLNIVMQFPVITNGSDTELILLRQKEYVETLKKNLAHPQVENIHLLLEKDEDTIFLEELDLESEKIVHYFLNRRMLYSDAFRYVSDFLLNQNAVIMNADCYLGEGFERLDPDILSEKTIYALTRHEPSYAKQYCGVKDFCSSSAKYIGSHDAFVVHLKQPLPRLILKTLMVRPDILGVEQFVIFTLRETGGFTVKNPCRILRIFHNHCTRLRHVERRFVHGKRLNTLYLSSIPRDKTNAPFSGL